MTTFDWQLAVALLCVIGAVVVILRRIRMLFGEKPGSGCGSSGCGKCTSAPTLTNLGEPKAFVSIQSLEQARNSGPDFTHTVKGEGKHPAAEKINER